MLNISNKAGLCTRGALTILAFICLGWFSPVRAETDPKFYAVMVTAQVQSSPAKITLTWSGDARATGYTISRNSGGSWTTVGNVSGTTTSWTDSNVSNGASYEYRVIKSTSAGYKGTGYLLAGINAPLKERHGKVILVVDNTHAADLSAELRRVSFQSGGRAMA